VTFTVSVVVALKEVVNDPQGLVVRAGLHQLGFEGVRDVRVGKNIVLNLDAINADEARQLTVQMCERLLRNPVIEDYSIDVVESLEPAR
jgi:phosphoribosylformylglycinamidine synthase subunit PurS